MNAISRTLLLFALACSAQAGDPAPVPPAEAKPAGAKATDAKPAEAKDAEAKIDLGRYELKNKSTFTVAPDVRAPFWPIGYLRNQKGTPTQGPKKTIDEHAFKVTSILVGNPSLAVINSRSYGEGEFIKLPRGSSPMRIVVQRINDGSVTLRYEDQMIICPLTRQEIQDKKADNEVLNAEK